MYFTEEEKEEIAKENIKLVKYVINKEHLVFRYDDIFDLGLIGLMNGINTFDKTKGFKLSTYLYKCIKNEIDKQLRSETCLKRNFETVSLNTIINEDGTELGEMLGYEYDYQDKLISDEIMIKITRRLSEISKENEEIFYHYLGINGYKKLSQVEIARKYKLSHQRVQEIVKKTKSILRYELREYRRENEN